MCACFQAKNAIESNVRTAQVFERAAYYGEKKIWKVVVEAVELAGQGLLKEVKNVSEEAYSMVSPPSRLAVTCPLHGKKAMDHPCVRKNDDGGYFGGVVHSRIVQIGFLNYFNWLGRAFCG